MLYNPAEYKYFKSLGSVNEKVGKLSLLPDVHAYKKIDTVVVLKSSFCSSH